jgi:murein DD-endopeptidase MepM/ murein hydrolase activator NlpD
VGRHNASRLGREHSDPAIPPPLPNVITTSATPASAAAPFSAAEFLAARSAETGKPRHRRSAERTVQARPMWRRSPAIPALAAALAVWGSADGYQLVAARVAGAQAGSAQHTAAGVATDLSALATGSQPGRYDGLTAGSERVSRGSRTRLTGQGLAPSASVLPARPSLPEIQDGKTVLGTWVRPSAGGMSSCFCMRWGVMHEGIDLAGPLGSPIVAVGDGVVLEAGPAAGFGHWIVIQHSNGDLSIYGHMYSVLVSQGEHVVAGQHIADIGADGESTGPHLHFGVRQGGMTGPYLDPVPWLKSRGIDVGAYNPNA